MILAIFGVSGVGKTFLCNQLSQRLNFKKFCKIKVRERRPEEVNSSDVIIADEKLLQTLQNEGKIAITISLFGNTYAFLNDDFNSSDNMVFEMNYLFFDEIKKINPNIFTLYILPNNINIPLNNIKNRHLKPTEEEVRVKEALEELQMIKNDGWLKKFDLIITNNFASSFIDDVIKKIKNAKVI